MSSQIAIEKPTHKELEDRVRELEDLLHALRNGEVDSVVSDRDPSQLLVLREYMHELQRERQLSELEAVVEMVPIALAIVWADGKIHSANPAFLDVVQPDMRNTLQAWAAGLRADDKFEKRLEERLRRCLDGSRQLDPLAVTFTDRRAKELHWVITFQQLPGEVGDPRGAVIAGTDVTQEKRLIAQLSDAKRQMEEFLAAVAHDLKSPLITIAHNLTFARMSQGDTLTAESAECLDRVRAAEKDMLNLLHQISVVSRAGRDTEPCQRQSVHELVQSALCQLGSTLAERRAVVILGDNLPELYCQGTKLIQVFRNLISNAVKYTPAGRTPHVEVGYRDRSAGEHLLFVCDNGSGIPEENLQRIFGLFDRLSADPNISGQGVGLTVVKRVVELHGGRIWAESVLGEGSTFYFTIPRQGRDSYACDNSAGDDLPAGRRQ